MDQAGSAGPLRRARARRPRTHWRRPRRRRCVELELQGKALDELAQGEGADSRERAARVAAFNRQREVAAQALWELRVHREALGFRRNDDLAAMYPIPPKRA